MQGFANISYRMVFKIDLISVYSYFNFTLSEVMNDK